MLTNKLEKEKQKLVNEKCQLILADLLRDEDNKYCVDCDAKGPRWAAWNLGIFLCIRCAGIHRNLGVHISKVKSVNLDAWTAEQIACLQQMGNSKARAVYEANLPDNFRRPQTDSSLEAFVRAKYEQKKYIAKEWVQPPPPKPAFDIEEEVKKEKDRKRNRNKQLQSANNIEVQANRVPRPNSTPAGTSINADKIPQESVKRGETESNNSTLDLLGLDISSSTEAKTDDDSFGLFVSSSITSNSGDNSAINQNNSKLDEESDFFNQKAPIDEKKVMSTESILSLYSNASANQPIQQQQQSLFGGINSSQNVAIANQSLLMSQFATPQPMASQQTSNTLLSQQLAFNILPTNSIPISEPQKQMSNSVFPLTTNPFLANNSTVSNTPSQQLSQHMASLQLGSMPAVSVGNNLPVMANNWFNGQMSTGLPPVAPAGLINPFMTATPQLIPTGVPVNNFSGANLNTSTVYSQPDSTTQWPFGANSMSQPGITALNNLWD